MQADIKALLDEAEALTALNRALNLIIAFNYGGRDEIARAARKLAEGGGSRADRRRRGHPGDLCRDLDTAGIPDPDLVIRTSGELRLSNFLPWQAAYSEFVFLPCFWPDFSRTDLVEAIRAYARARAALRRRAGARRRVVNGA